MVQKIFFSLLVLPFLTNGQKKIEPGTTQFNLVDRIAIKDVIDAYGFYWDSNNLEGYLSLFEDDAIGVTVNEKGEVEEYLIKSKQQIEKSRLRMTYFQENNMQRRHMASNTLVLHLSENSAHLRQYMTLLTTNHKLKTEILTPIDYVFRFRKVDGIWKITYREINLDKPLDLSL